MRSTFEFLFVIFLFNPIVTVFAAYCCRNSSTNCCPYAGLGGKTCPGIGTTDTADLLGYIYPGGETYAIVAGYGVYVITSVSYKLLKGTEAVIYLNTIYGFVLEVPNKSGGQTYYLIDLTGCPTIKIITPYTHGTVQSTTLPYATICEIIKKTNQTYSAPCNTVPGLDIRRSRNEFSNLDVDTPLTLSNVISFQYNTFNKKYDKAPNDFIRKYGLRVDNVDSAFYVQSGYMKDAESCYKPDKLPPLGQGLVEAGFDFAKVFQENGLCLLGTAIGKATAASIHPYYLYSLKLCLVFNPYDYVIIVAGYFQTDLGNVLYRSLFELC